ncbi:MAG: indole-3-glycerol phosphate synthase TrpC [Deltaproteobacteria bacterium]|nr:indole-3-glycerol phosphate synthase TrpC [Deltaproteobacteria bacterium]MCL5892185.1 indole-3-glycerol phosphate synthase TrpC [Deltaproteobacteria bacterium]
MILDDILKEKTKEVEKFKASINEPEYKAQAYQAFYGLRSLKKALKPRSNGEAVSYRICSIIAEVKKASPSKGVLIRDFKPDEIAEVYEKAGASAISVLTDKTFFMGSPSDILKVRNAVHLPILRKDFIIDEIQVFESKIIGADAILLIIKALSSEQYKNLLSLARELSLEVLTEISNDEELDTAMKYNAEIIGINSRDLLTFKTDLFKTARIAEKIPPGKLIVAESGISGRGDIEMLMKRGINSFLIGEALVTSDDALKKLKNLLLPYTINSYL